VLRFFGDALGRIPTRAPGESACPAVHPSRIPPTRPRFRSLPVKFVIPSRFFQQSICFFNPPFPGGILPESPLPLIKSRTALYNVDQEGVKIPFLAIETLRPPERISSFKRDPYFITASRLSKASGRSPPPIPPPSPVSPLFLTEIQLRAGQPSATPLLSGFPAPELSEGYPAPPPAVPITGFFS